MRVFRRRWSDEKGRKRTSGKWSIGFKDHQGVERRLPAFTDRTATETLARRLKRLVALRAVGEGPDVELMQWLDGLPRPILDRLAEWGLVEPHRAGGARFIDEHVEEWEEALLARGNTEKYARQAMRRVKRLAAGCGFQLPRDTNGGRVESWLKEQVENGTFGVATRNHYLTAFKTFCRWMEREGRLAINPGRFLRRVNAAPDLRRERRALADEECRKLLKRTAESEKVHHGMDGPERALLYRLALESGLRWSELRSLKVGNLDLDGKPPTVRVEAAYTKNGREDALPVRPATAELLGEHCRLKTPGARLFGMWQTHGGEMLRDDLGAAGVDYEDDRGRVADFHALRHTFVSNLARSGVHPKVAQDLARHSDIKLTMSTYTHTLMESRAQAVGDLPDFDGEETDETAAREKGGSA